ncbi:exosortase A [Thalassotalea euphylliae]|uniref:Exosortase A n=1 Tax=Thalassotalea euphylliae TaxID=1655234 RepID=A0A3E0TL07_9GAMM|nr:exosortase A [Thalassotalea euphylliae]REL25198.1 exosortase A [Thalassotalea euphylliae]
MMAINSRQFMMMFAVLMTGWVLVFWDGIAGMEAIWRRSDTFAHGYFILPIVIWLLYRDRAYLMSARAQSTWLPLPFLLMGCFVWLFAFAADINVLSQLAAVLVLVSLVWMLIGNHLAWRYKFPLAYLLFAVPMGENLIPDLQDITAWITVFLLKVHGIPVFRDGWYIQIPTGMFEVAVACSGIRYLIASMAVGTLYAYLTYRSFKKQLLFVVFAFLLPILANGVRAYLIVIIAHYSDMKYATGADHLVYGWIFFGFVIMLMFWVGGKFADPERKTELYSDGESTKSKGQRNKLWAGASACLLMMATWLVERNINVLELPESAATVMPMPASNWGVSFTQPMQSNYQRETNGTELFFARYGNKQSEGELVSFANKLYDAERWTVIDRITNNDNGQVYRYLLLRDVQGRERALLYWYQIGNRKVVSPAFVKLHQALALLTGQADFAYFVAASSLATEQQNIVASLLNSADSMINQITLNQVGN